MSTYEWNKLVAKKKIEIEALQKWPSFFIPFINSIKKKRIEKKNPAFFLSFLNSLYFDGGGQFKISWRKPPREKRSKTLIDTLAAVAVATTTAKWMTADKKSVRQQLKRSIGCSSVMRYTRRWGGVGCWGIYGVERKEDNLGELDGVYYSPPFSDRRWRRSWRLGTRNIQEAEGGGREEWNATATEMRHVFSPLYYCIYSSSFILSFFFL